MLLYRHKQLLELKKEIEFKVGPDRLHKSLLDFHNYLIAEKQKGRLSYNGIPISVCIKYTTPAEPIAPKINFEQLTIQQ